MRCRPPLDFEHKAGHTFEKLIVDSNAKGVSAWNDRTNGYKNANFDIVLDQSVTQAKVFDQSGMYGLVKHVIDGYHATVFAYGQTGSGKTFTMEGYRYQTVSQGKPP